jgi:hypothetical protein
MFQVIIVNGVDTVLISLIHAYSVLMLFIDGWKLKTNKDFG